jgi:sugar/nucleoside kinase (ribokinase family)
MYDVITIGSVTRDAFFKSGDFKVEQTDRSRTGKFGCFILGTKIEIPEVVFTTGGGSTNVAVGFARMGLKTACVGRIGNDVSGEEIKKELEKENVFNLLQTDKKANTAYSLILVAPDGERTILEYRGANDGLSEKEISWKKIKSKWLFLNSLSGNIKLLKQAIDWAKENKVKIAFNPGKRLIKMGKELKPFLKNIDIFIVNEDEAGFVAGIKYEKKNEKKFFSILHNAINKGIVVMTKGPEGVVVSDKKELYKAGVPDSPVVDRTGAGDAFSSGFVSAYIQNNGDIESSIQIGTANATLVVQYFGAKKGLLKKRDLNKFWRKWKKVKVSLQKVNEGC